MTKILSDKILSKDELAKMSNLLRGLRRELAQRAGVSIATVNNTMQGNHQNAAVIKMAYELLKEQMEKPAPEVEGIRAILQTVGD